MLRSAPICQTKLTTTTTIGVSWPHMSKSLQEAKRAPRIVIASRVPPRPSWGPRSAFEVVTRGKFGGYFFDEWLEGYFSAALDLLPVVASFAGPSKTIWNGLWQQVGHEAVSVSNRSRLQEEEQRLRRNQCSRTAWQVSELGPVESFCVMHRHSIHIFSFPFASRKKAGVAFCILQGCATSNMFAVCMSYCSPKHAVKLW